MDVKTTSKIILGSLAVLLTSSIGVSSAHAYITPGEFLGEPSTTKPLPLPLPPPEALAPIQTPPAIPLLPPRPPIDLLPIPKLEPAKSNAGTSVPDARDQIFQTRHSVRPTLTRTKDLIPVPARLQYAPAPEQEEIMHDPVDPVAERAARRAKIVRPALSPSPNLHNAALPQSGAGVGLILLASAMLAGGLRMLRRRHQC